MEDVCCVSLSELNLIVPVTPFLFTSVVFHTFALRLSVCLNGSKTSVFELGETLTSMLYHTDCKVRKISTVSAHGRGHIKHGDMFFTSEQTFTKTTSNSGKLPRPMF